MNRPVRTRYAPSPTGDPHVGNIRAALFSWALARVHNGQFILRIEDTDQARLVETSLTAIQESLRWLGLDWDEGPEIGGPHAPYFQSQRLELYHKAAASLLDSGNAYRCFCTTERLNTMRKAQQAAKRPPGYDGLCRNVPADESLARAKTEPFTVRFKMRREGETVLNDLIRGEVRFDNRLQDDFVALKSDGYPTYHLAVVVDDTEMEITHTIRGDEWISSAPKHIQLYEALGWEPPDWVHLPLILGPDKKKLSKRTGDTALLDYRDRGYLPEAMVNFLSFLGWSLDDHTSLITGEELAKHFSIERVVPNPAVFDIERLDYLNGHYIREMADDRWLELVTTWAERELPAEIERPLDPTLLAAAAPLLKDRVRFLADIAPMVEFLFTKGAPAYEAQLLAERLAGDMTLADRVLELAEQALGAQAELTAATVEAAIRSLEGDLEMKLRKFVPVLYVAIMGKAQGIPLFESIAILGRRESHARIARGRATLAAKQG